MSAMKRVMRIMSRREFAALLMVILATVVAIGSLFPQVSTGVASEVPNWREVLRVRYGEWTGALVALGAFRFARSPLFLVPVLLLAVASIVWSGTRWRHLAYRRYRVRDVAMLATHVASVPLLAGAVLTAALGWEQQVQIPSGATAVLGEDGSLSARNEGLVVERYPDGSPAHVVARVTLLEDDVPVVVSDIMLNAPLRYDGYALYLQDYGLGAGGYDLTLLVTWDPGWVPFLLGGALLLAGAALTLCRPGIRLGKGAERADVDRRSGPAAPSR